MSKHQRKIEENTRERFTRYSIRKYSVGAASVAILSGFFFVPGGGIVRASEITAPQVPNNATEEVLESSGGGASSAELAKPAEVAEKTPTTPATAPTKPGLSKEEIVETEPTQASPVSSASEIKEAGNPETAEKAGVVNKETPKAQSEQADKTENATRTEEPAVAEKAEVTEIPAATERTAKKLDLSSRAVLSAEVSETKPLEKAPATTPGSIFDARQNPAVRREDLATPRQTGYSGFRSIENLTGNQINHGTILRKDDAIEPVDISKGTHKFRIHGTARNASPIHADVTTTRQGNNVRVNIAYTGTGEAIDNNFVLHLGRGFSAPTGLSIVGQPGARIVKGQNFISHSGYTLAASATTNGGQNISFNIPVNAKASVKDLSLSLMLVSTNQNRGGGGEATSNDPYSNSNYYFENGPLYLDANPGAGGVAEVKKIREVVERQTLYIPTSKLAEGQQQTLVEGADGIKTTQYKVHTFGDKKVLGLPVGTVRTKYGEWDPNNPDNPKNPAKPLTDTPQPRIVLIGVGKNVLDELPQGPKGDKGETGDRGQDGASPTVTATRKNQGGKSGVEITITPANGGKPTVTFVEDGAKGEKGDRGETGARGPVGPKGADGRNGVDGKTPTITVTEGRNGTHIITVNNPGSQPVTTTIHDGAQGPQGKQGIQGPVGPQGPKGDKGADGRSLVAIKNGTETKIFVENPANPGHALNPNSPLAVIKDGTNGRDGAAPTISAQRTTQGGKTGVLVTITPAGGRPQTTFVEDGAKGADGKTPTITVANGNGTHTITINNPGSTPQTAVIRDGVQGPRGEKGERGEQGAAGRDGASPTVTAMRTERDGKGGVEITVTPAGGGTPNRTFVPDGERGLPGLKGEDGKSIRVVTSRDDKKRETTLTFYYDVDGNQAFDASKDTVVQTAVVKDGRTPTVSVSPAIRGVEALRTAEDQPKPKKGTEVKFYYDNNGNGVYDEDIDDPIDNGFIPDGRDGENGANGRHGAEVLSGKGTPDAKNGQNGDTYIDTNSGDTYKKEGGQWVKNGNIKGPKGDQGERGETGPKGETGARGERGERGETGPKGETGPRGEQGAAGRDGVDGRSLIAVKEGTDTKIFVENPKDPGKPLDAEHPLAIIHDGTNGHDGQSPTITAKRGQQDGKAGVLVTITPVGGQPQTVFVADGERGPQGDRGERGETGPKGETGARGETGPRGEQGLPGRDGRDGVNGKTPKVSTARGQDGKSTDVTFTIEGEKPVTFNIKDGEQGPQGLQGLPGAKGKDGVTPTVKVVDNEDGTKTITINDGNGNTTNAIVSDGASPLVATQRNEETKSTTVIFYYDMDGNDQFNEGDVKIQETIIRDGEQGPKGDKGENGLSPVINAQRTTQGGKNGVEITITPAGGATPEKVFVADGTDGAVGPKGDRGERGETGPKGDKGEAGARGQDGASPTVTATRKTQGGKSGVEITITPANGGKPTVTFVEDGAQGPTGPKGEQGERGEVGPRGETGAQGLPGEDGKSPTVTAERGQQNGKQGVLLTITPADGGEAKTVFVADGEKGQDGKSLIAKKEGNVTKVYQEDPAHPGQPLNENKPLAIINDGQNGADGKSPTVTAIRKEKDGKNGVEITITPANGGEAVVTFVEDGAKGADGAQGPAGQKGRDGKDVLNGQGKPEPGLGKNGDKYVDTKTWDVYVKDGNSWRKEGNIKGADGQDGVDGKTPTLATKRNEATKTTEITFFYDKNGNGTYEEGEDELIKTETVKDGQDGAKGTDGHDVLSGKGVPTAKDGKDGDSYVDTETGEVYKRTGDQWNSVGNIKGPKGEKGENGRDGKSLIAVKDGKETKVYQEDPANPGHPTGNVLAVIKDGVDGTTPTITAERKDEPNRKGVEITIIPKDGSQPTKVFVQDGEKGDKGEKGQDGKSLIAKKEGNVTKVYQEDPAHPGQPLNPDSPLAIINDGQNGADGKSPTVTAVRKEKDGKNGVEITITPANGGEAVVTFVEDGAKGSDGAQGPAGQNGHDGKDVLNGQGKPADGLGKDGDKYVDTTTWDVYVKGENGWTKEGNIKGADGHDGVDGRTPTLATKRNENAKTTEITFFYDKNGNGTYEEGEDTLIKTETIKDGERGEKGETGERGQDGHDGKELRVLSQRDDANKTTALTFYYDADGDGQYNPDKDELVQTSVIRDGQDGKTPEIVAKPGQDGKSTDITFTIEGKKPVTVNVKNGEDGLNGKTPKVDLLHIEGQNGKPGHTIVTFYVDENNDNKYTTQTDTLLGSEMIRDGEKGADGTNGRDGKDVLNGKVDPQPNQGKDGDKFVNTETGDVFVKTGDTWTKEGNIKGPKGEKGDKGENGRDGRDGFTPEVTVKDNQDGSHTITITQPNGKPALTTTIQDGQDGISPSVKTLRDEVKKESKLIFYYDVDGDGEYGKDDEIISETIVKDGQNGTNGRDGKDVLNGKVDPEPNQGKDGDKFVNTETGDVFVKTGNTWTKEGNIKGPKGEKGDKGENGRDGFTPEVTVKDNQDGSHTITITQPNGKPALTTTIQDGQDGISPSVKTIRDEAKKESKVIFYYDVDGDGEYGKDDEIISETIVKDGEKGADGTNGRDGKDVLNGKVDPQPNQGKDGDKFVNTETGDVFVKTGDTWTKEGNIKGPKGDKGENGRDGRDGFTPEVTVKDNQDGSHTITITQSGDKPALTTTVKDGRDGQTPKVKAERDEAKKETTFTFYIDKDGSGDYTEGDTILQTSVVKDGQNGTNGRDGKDVLNGKVDPQPNQGKDGDKFVNTETGDVFVKTGDTWTKEGNIKGPKGEKGDKGENGRDGRDGFTPEVTVKDNQDGSHTITITQPNGKPALTTTIQDGQDGISPSVKTIRDEAKKESKLIFYYDVDGDGEYGKDDEIISETIVKDGQNGTNGRDGKDVLNGKVDPQPNQGKDGDKFVNTETGDVFVKTGDAWTKEGNIKGPKGDKGENGRDGFTPEVTVKDNQDGSHTITITQPNGKPALTTTIQDGQDGISPSVKTLRDEVKKESKVIFYYDVDGDGEYGKDDEIISETIVKDGQNGADGKSLIAVKVGKQTKVYQEDPVRPGQPLNPETPLAIINDGADGKTPEITSKPGADGHSTDLTITVPGKDPVTVNVKDGKDGKTPTVTAVRKDEPNHKGVEITITPADGGEPVVTFVKDGDKGEKGDTPTISTERGKDGKSTNVTFTLPGKDPVTINVKDGKDGRTPRLELKPVNEHYTFRSAEGAERSVNRHMTHVTAYFDENGNGQFDPGIDTVLSEENVSDGLDGHDGRRAAEVLSGQTNPTAKDGKDGDTYINTATGDVYKKENGTWKPAGNIMGPKGEKGDTPTITTTPGADGKSTDVTITVPGKDPVTVNVKDGKDGRSLIAKKEGNETKVYVEDPAHPGEALDATKPLATILDGEKGDAGRDGVDGKSPTVSLKNNGDGTHTLTVTDTNGGTQTSVIRDGKDGKTAHITMVDNQDGSHTITVTDPNGGSKSTVIRDGQSPKVEVIDNQNGSHTIKVTDPSGHETSAIIKDGKDGKAATAETKTNPDGSHTIIINNPDGSHQEFVVKNGRDGVDGKSPTATVRTNGDDTHTITIINPDGSKSETTVKDGKDGRSTQVSVRDNHDGTYTIRTEDPNGKVTETVFHDGKTPKIDVIENHDGSHTIRITKPDGSTTDTLVRDGKDGKSATASVVDNHDGTHTIKIVNPDGTISTTTVRDGKSPKVDVMDNHDGSYTIKVTNTDGQETNTIIRDGKSPKAKVTDNGDGTHTLTIIDSDGHEYTSIIKDGKDGKSPTATVRNNGNGTHTVTIVNTDGSVTETIIKDGKDGQSPTVTVTDNGDGTHTVTVINVNGVVYKTIIRDGKCGCDKPKPQPVPTPTPQPTPVPPRTDMVPPLVEVPEEGHVPTPTPVPPRTGMVPPLVEVPEEGHVPTPTPVPPRTGMVPPLVEIPEEGHVPMPTPTPQPVPVPVSVVPETPKKEEKGTAEKAKQLPNTGTENGSGMEILLGAGILLTVYGLKKRKED